MKAEAEFEIMLPQSKECLGLPKLDEARKGPGPFLEGSEGAWLS